MLKKVISFVLVCSMVLAGPVSAFANNTDYTIIPEITKNKLEFLLDLTEATEQYGFDLNDAKLWLNNWLYNPEYDDINAWRANLPLKYLSNDIYQKKAEYDVQWDLWWASDSHLDEEKPLLNFTETEMALIMQSAMAVMFVYDACIYCPNHNISKCLVNNAGPLAYKILDLAEAIRDKDGINIYILYGQIFGNGEDEKGDLNSLLEYMGVSEDDDVKNVYINLRTTLKKELKDLNIKHYNDYTKFSYSHFSDIIDYLSIPCSFVEGYENVMISGLNEWIWDSSYDDMLVKNMLQVDYTKYTSKQEQLTAMFEDMNLRDKQLFAAKLFASFITEYKSCIYEAKKCDAHSADALRCILDHLIPCKDDMLYLLSNLGPTETIDEKFMSLISLLYDYRVLVQETIGESEECYKTANSYYQELRNQLKQGYKQTHYVHHVSSTGVIKEEDNYKNCLKGENCLLYQFDDLDTTEWYHDGIHYCLDEGFMNGVSSKIFDPNNNTSRAMMATILARLDGEEANATGPEWYVPGMNWAKTNGISDGSNPTGSITREQFAAMLYRYAKSQGKGFVGDWYFLLEFSDAADISDWADEAMHWCVMKGIMTGKSASILDPQSLLTRAEAAAMIQRFCCLNN